MNSKIIETGSDSRVKLLSGVKQLADAGWQSSPEGKPLMATNSSLEERLHYVSLD